MRPIILEAHDLTKKYRHTVALDHIDLQIEKGKIYGFIGQNGAGKTTFLRLVTGLAFPTSGILGLCFVETWQRSASCSCVKPASLRSVRTFSPSNFKSEFGIIVHLNSIVSFW